MLKSPPLGLYIHLPWCARKCPYCDFNSHEIAGTVPEAGYAAALLADLDSELSGARGRQVATIFIGGGTPSLFSAEAIAALLEGVRARLSVAEDAEITLEANPGSAESRRFRGYREAGVNRLSMGIQSFHPEHLARLGRIHDREEALQAAALARAAGFDNFNLDLMFGLPEQRPGEALKDVATALDLEPAHLSFYQFTLEPNTWFHKYPPRLPEAESVWEAQQECQVILAARGYRRYEVSAYARDGRQCRHNLNYWHFGDYLGIGAGAHGKLTDTVSGTVTRSWKIRHPGHYLAARSRAERLGGEARVEPGELPFEFLMNSLRLREGFVPADFSARTGLPAASLEPALSACLAEGLLEQDGGRVRCTATGYDFLDDVLQRFLP